MSVVSLTTDFGTKNEFVGTMKGVILGIVPSVQLVDITHAVPPQDIQAGAFALWRAYSFFPKHTVHMYVVDPGVGTKRRAIAARLGEQFFVGPDNGLLTPIIEDAERANLPIEFVQLENENYFLPKISRTFHGRDIFSPVAAHLANGVDLHELGSVVTDPIRMSLPKPQKMDKGWNAHITVIDSFGNLTLDLPSSALQNQTGVLFRFQGAEIQGVAESYGHRAAGELVAVVDSEDFIEIAVVNGNASMKLGAKTGDVVEVILSE